MNKMEHMTVRDMKDLVRIYNDNEDYKLELWNPMLQRHMRLYFTGSSNPEKSIHFNVGYIDGDQESENVFKAFSKVLSRIKSEGIDSADWEKEFVKEIYTITFSNENTANLPQGGQ